MNAVMLSGTLARNPVIRTSPKTTVALFTVITLRHYNGSEYKDYIDCVAFGAAAQNVGNNGGEGTPIEVVGRIGKRKYQKNGQDMWVTEVNAITVDIPTNSAPPQQERGHWGGFGQTPPQESGENIPF